jgi:hypothetical protein
MAIQTSYNRWDVATADSQKIFEPKPLSQAFWKPGDSHFWTSLMKVKQDFLPFGTFTIKNGSQIRFWEDIWLGTTALRDQYLAYIT